MLIKIGFLFIIIFFIVFSVYYFFDYKNAKDELSNINYNNVIEIEFYSQYNKVNSYFEKELSIKNRDKIKSIIQQFKYINYDNCSNYYKNDTTYNVKLRINNTSVDKHITIALKECNIKDEENILICYYLDKGAKCFESYNLYKILLKLNLEKWKNHKKIILNKYNKIKNKIKSVLNIKSIEIYSYADSLPRFASLRLDKPILIIKNRSVLSEFKNCFKNINLNTNIIKCRYKYLMKIKSKKDNWFILCRNKLNDSNILLSLINIRKNGKLFSIQNKEDIFYFESKELFSILRKYNLKKWR